MIDKRIWTTLFLVLVNLVLIVANISASEWDKKVIDKDGDVGKYTSIVLDKKDKVHISYHDFKNGYLKYATNTNGSWTTEIVDSGADNNNKTSDYSSTRIAVDASGKIHIVYRYRNNSHESLKYATNTSGSWVTEIVGSNGGSYNSLALDSSGKVHISYYDETNHDLKYVTNHSGSWVTHMVDTPDDKYLYVGLYNSIVLDSSDKVHISYFVNTDTSKYDFAPTIRYANNASGSWVIMDLDSHEVEFTFGCTSIAIDTSDKVHISYCLGKQDYYLYYVNNTSGFWVKEYIENANQASQFNSLAVDKSGNAHISYYKSIYTTLMYVTNTNGDWETNEVDTPYDTGIDDSRYEKPGWYNSIALDGYGNVHISYYDGYYGNLKYATKVTQSTPTPSPTPSPTPTSSFVVQTITAPSVTTVSSGKVLGPFSITESNNGSSYYSFYVQPYVTKPDGTTVNFSKLSTGLNAGETRKHSHYLDIPAASELGTFTFGIKLTDTSGSVIDNDSFTFTVKSGSSAASRRGERKLKRMMRNPEAQIMVGDGWKIVIVPDEDE